MSKKKIVIFGAGGFAREVRFLIERVNASKAEWQFSGYVVSDLSRLGDRDSKADVVGDLDWLERQAGKTVDAVVIGIGTPGPRARIGAELRQRIPHIELPSLVDPSVIFDPLTTQIGAGVILCPGVIAPANAVFEDFSMCNMACTVGHEARIGRGTVVNPSANISGGVVIEDEVLVGVGAQILQYVRVGAGAIVGAGALVLQDVPAKATVFGVPAKVISRSSSA
jgi:sugar O-acyltransferase (sialic acid O-acetyltransferase NeuD family)